MLLPDRVCVLTHASIGGDIANRIRMRALGVRTFGKRPDILEVPAPTSLEPDDILIQVKAVGLNQVDAARTLGYSRLFETVKLPLVIGHDYAGVVSEVGTAVTDFVPGDRVYGFSFKAGCAAEYMLLSSKFKYIISKIPDELSFDDAASLPIAAHTAIQALTRADNEILGGLEGKTVLVTAGLGGVGTIALQLLKPVFGAEKVITTVSTKKVTLVAELLGEGKVDQIVDYTTQDVVTEIGKGTVDFFLDTANKAMSYVAVVKPETGFLLSIVGKSGETMAKDWAELPWWLKKVLDWIDAMFRWRASRRGVKYDHAFTQFTGTDSERIARWVRDGKLKAVVGKIAGMDDLEAVKEMFEAVSSGKGATGKYVVKIS